MPFRIQNYLPFYVPPPLHHSRSSPVFVHAPSYFAWRPAYRSPPLHMSMESHNRCRLLLLGQATEAHDSLCSPLPTFVGSYMPFMTLPWAGFGNPSYIFWDPFRLLICFLWTQIWLAGFWHPLAFTQIFCFLCFSVGQCWLSFGHGRPSFLYTLASFLATPRVFSSPYLFLLWVWKPLFQSLLAVI